MAMKIPGGPAKGTPIPQAKNENIEYWLGRSRERLAKEPDGENASFDRKWIAEAEEELRMRAEGKQPDAPPEKPAAPAQRAFDASDVLEFRSTDPKEITGWFAANQGKYHVISPATVVQTLPLGWEVAITIIRICSDPEFGEVYPIKAMSGDSNVYVALTGSSLARIGQGAGVSFDPRQLRRLDDQKDANVSTMMVVGAYRLFDGTVITDHNIKNVDLRDTSAQIIGQSPNWLNNQRSNIVEMSETKAKNRFLRRLGLKSKYITGPTINELNKPFAVARSMMTGRVPGDPELERRFAMMMFGAALGGAEKLFGPGVTAQALIGSGEGRRSYPGILPGGNDEDF